MPDDQSCKSCKFFLEEKPNNYVCRRYPPLNHYEPIIINNPVSKFPKTTPESWCGEYTKKPK